MTRNAVAVFDPALARRAAQAELHAKEKAAPKRHPANAIGGPAPQLSDDAKARMGEALRIELAKMAAREDERRRRDPTFRPDALDLDSRAQLPFDRFADYYGVLSVHQHASAAELKAAFREKTLQHHLDKQRGKSEAEADAAREAFHALTGAYAILTQPATRRANDAARE